MFKLDLKLTKEQNLQLARESTDLAKSFLNQFAELTAAANMAFPTTRFGLSTSQREKTKTTAEVLKRLQEAKQTLSNTESFYRDKERQEAELERKQKAETSKQEADLKRNQILNEALKYCLDNGRTFDNGLTVDNAIQKANDIAYVKAIREREDSIGDDYINFSGQNCEDPCAGWNPNDYRCQCGNRRVTWTEGWSSDFRNMTVYAEAY